MSAAEGSARDSDAPDDPTDLNRTSWKATLKRTITEFQNDNLTDWAAALTYYAVLAIFPALIALISILGLVGDSATNALLDNLTKLTPGTANQVITDAIENITASESAAGLGLVLGIAGALFSASGYVGGFSRASNAIYEVEEGRPFWKLRPIQIAITTVMITLLAICALAIVVTGPVAEQVGNLVGAGDADVTVWDIAKWPLILAVVMAMFAILYWAAPNVKHPKFSWVSPGGVVGVILWILASAAFAFYVANFASYNKTYGALGGVIVFLVWLWISNIAVLLGAEFDAELERGRQIEAGQPPDQEPFLEPRDTRKMKDG